MMTACIGGWFDRVVTGISQVFIAFPTLIIAVAIIGVLGNGLQNIIWAVVISMWARFMQMIRTYAKTELGRDYIVAARVSGCGMWQLIVHHYSQYPSAVFGVFFNGRNFRPSSRFPAFRFSALVCPAERLNGAQCWRSWWRCIPTRNCSFTPVSAFHCRRRLNLFGEALRDILQPQEDVL
ncbi:MAG: ABC transporter permease subunit [Anaeromassilibacillus sp.]